MKRLGIVGGGPAGMAAAFSAQDCEVTLFERNEKLGKKLYITGKGRCNLTNTGNFFEHIPRNHRFLYSAYNGFSHMDLIALMRSLGVETKVERGGRVFPCSDKSSDVLRALEKKTRMGAKVLLGTRVESVRTENGRVTGLRANGSDYGFDAVVLATGGLSYPSTGSTGDGYRFSGALGHRIQPPAAALVPLETVEEWPFSLSGLTLKNVVLRAYENEKICFSELGEMLFTHFGVSGPLILSASSLLIKDPPWRLEIDLKPALSPEQIEQRLRREIEAAPRRSMPGLLETLLPKRLAPIFAALAGLDGQKAAQLTREERQRLAVLFKRFPLTVKGTRPIDEAIVTRGGVDVREINPSTMESRRVAGLYFAGELMDVDGVTGGYNLQIAFSTGVLAGRSAARD